MDQLWFPGSFITASSHYWRRAGGGGGPGWSCGYMYTQVHALNMTASMLYLLDKRQPKEPNAVVNGRV